MSQEGNTHSLNERAEGDLRLIRSMMQRSARIMPMPGWGIFSIGLVGIITPFFTRSLVGLEWLIAWGIAAVIALAIALATSSWQLRRSGRSIFVGNHSRFWIALGPGFLAAALLSVIFFRLDELQPLAGLWLLLYGVAVVAAGNHSLRQVTWMGYSFLFLGAVFLFLPWPNVAMGLGFGGLHLLFGYLIARTNSD